MKLSTLVFLIALTWGLYLSGEYVGREEALDEHRCPVTEKVYPTREQYQTFLRDNYNPDLVVDGYFGPESNLACELYELDLIALEIDGGKYETD